MKSKGDEYMLYKIKCSIAGLKMKRSYSNLSVIIIIGDCALRRKKEEEREREMNMKGLSILWSQML